MTTPERTTRTGRFVNAREGAVVQEDPGVGVGSPDESDGEGLSFQAIDRYLRAPLRRPAALLIPWATIVALSVAAIFILPPRYRSSTLIIVEQQPVPDSFVPRVATGKERQLIENVRSEILSRTRLERVVAELNPYPEVTSKTAAVEAMRERIKVWSTGSDGIIIEFVHGQAQRAQQVANRLATLFIEETMRSREQQVTEAVAFLATQVEESRKELETKDLALRRFKEARMGRLPEQLQTNLTTMQSLQRELQSVEESLYLARTKEEALARSVATGVDVGPTGLGDRPSPPGGIDALSRELAALRQNYTDEHPDVQNLRARIARIQERSAAITPAEGPSTSDPALQVTRAQLASATSEIQRLEERRRDLERRITLTSQRVEETPRTEQELATLTRDYNKLQENYTSLLTKELDAQMSGRLEERWKGERFRMLDPANLPEKPDFPRPPLFIGGGILLGLAVGLATAMAFEFMDSTVKSVEDLQKLQAHPVLARIPHLAGARRPTRA
jgi:polysaccharide chain length determinant protein (PEP-CTERM system associated)